MTKKNWNKHLPAFKAKVALAAIKGCTDVTYIPMAKGFLYLVAPRREYPPSLCERMIGLADHWIGIGATY